MNLKFYLRGLGLGIIVTAIIMGIVVGGKSEKLSDAEIKERAAKLGMVDGRSTLVDEEPTAEDLLDELNSETVETPTDSVIAAADAFLNDDPDLKEDTVLDDTTSDDYGDLEESDEPQATETATEDTTDDEGVDEAASDANNTESLPENDYPTEDDTSLISSSGDMVTFVISSGDSSYTVAKKLVDAGLVPNASDYDAYLCQYGYDRHIRTGTYQVASGASNEEIAKLITGK